MLMMVIFAVMSAGLLYAAKVPAIQEEWNLLLTGSSGGSTGGSAGGVADAGRGSHIVFIMFTFTSPLLLAGSLSTAMMVVRRLNRTGHQRID